MFMCAPLALSAGHPSCLLQVAQLRTENRRLKERIDELRRAQLAPTKVVRASTTFTEQPKRRREKEVKLPTLASKGQANHEKCQMEMSALRLRLQDLTTKHAVQIESYKNQLEDRTDALREMGADVNRLQNLCQKYKVCTGVREGGAPWPGMLRLLGSGRRGISRWVGVGGGGGGPAGAHGRAQDASGSGLGVCLCGRHNNASLRAAVARPEPTRAAAHHDWVMAAPHVDHRKRRAKHRTGFQVCPHRRPLRTPASFASCRRSWPRPCRRLPPAHTLRRRASSKPRGCGKRTSRASAVPTRRTRH